MNSKRVILVLIALSVVLPASICSADSESEARRAIQSRYSQFNAAYTKKDFKTVGEIFSPDCVLRLNSEGRSMKAARAVRGMRALSGSLTVTNAKTQIISIKTVGDGFEVAAVWTGDSKYTPGKSASDDPPRQAKTRQSYRDTWKKTDKGWQITNRIIGDADDDDKKSQPKK